MHSLIMCVSSVSSFSVHPCLLHTQTLFQMWSNAVYIYNVYHTIINHFHFNSVFNEQNRTRHELHWQCNYVQAYKPTSLQVSHWQLKNLMWFLSLLRQGLLSCYPQTGQGFSAGTLINRKHYLFNPPIFFRINQRCT